MTTQSTKQMSTQKQRVEQIQKLQNLGFNYDEANQLRRIALTLSRWDELECGTGTDRVSVSVERDETTGKPSMRRQWMGYNNTWQDVSTPCHDREKGAEKRLAKLMAEHPELVSYRQTDPRGASLYILKKSELNGSDIEQVYYRGTAISD